MTFLYPLGLLGLIGVPILIIIYIIKNKYTEQVITSTYLWTLSEKFLKKRLPINKLVGLISLILQILAVIMISLAVSHPVLLISNGANDYYFILDGSGSMNFVQDDKSRLDLAKDEISTIINNSSNGSVYTLVFVGDTSSVIFSEVSDKQTAIKSLEEITPSCSAPGFTDVLGSAQEFFNANPSVLTYLVTDKDFEMSDNVEVINVSDGEENYAISDVSYSLSESLEISGSVISYSSDADIEIQLYLDGLLTVEDTQTVKCEKLAVVPFTFKCSKSDFTSIKLVITNTDALPLDNEITVYNVEYENSFSVLLVSDSPFYMQAVLATMSNARTEVISPSEYVSADGYDLCVFGSFTPETLPEQSAVWFINPTASLAGSGFTVQDEEELTTASKMKYSTSTATLVKTLLDGVIKEDVYVKKYQKCGLYRNFTTLLTCGDSPLVFTGTNEYGNREVVFAFDLQDSNFPVLQDYIVLAGNLLGFAFPTVIENASYYCGETLQVNVIANCDSIRVDSPEGKINYLDISNAISELTLTEVGTYTVTVTAGDTQRKFNVYSAFPEEERIPTVTESFFSIQGEAGTEKRNGIFDNLFILVILLAVLFAADWVVYCYEQYQLR